MTSLQSSRLLPVEGSKRSAQVSACRELVDSLVDMQLGLRRRLLALQSDLQQHQQHAERLKDELNRACQRHLDAQVPETFENVNIKPREANQSCKWLFSGDEWR